MTVGQKASLSLLVAVLVFAAFAVAAFSGLFQVVEAKFYNPSVASSFQKSLDTAAKEADTWHRNNLKNFQDVLAYGYVRRSFLPNTSAEDSFQRSNAFGKLQEETPGLVGFRFVDSAGKRIHFSNLAQDILKQGPTETLYRNYGDASDIPYESIASPEKTAPGQAVSGRVILDPVQGRFIYSLPFFDDFNVYRGTAFLFVSQTGLVSTLLRAGLLGVGDDAAFAGDRGVVLRPPVAGREILLGRITELWQAGPSKEPLPLTEGEGLVLFANSTSYAGYLGLLAPKSAFLFPTSMKWLLLTAFFITAYLLAFLLLNLRQDRMTILSDRIKRFQIGLLEGYLDNKADLDFGRWSRELEARRGEVKNEFKRSIGKKRRGGDAEVDELIDKSWDEILSILGKRAGGEALPSGLDVREVERLIAAALKSGTFVLPSQGLVAAPQPSPQAPSPQPPAPRPLAVAAVSPVEGSLEDVDEIEDLEDFEDAEPAPEPTAPAIAAASVDALEDAVEEAESVEDFEELEDAEEEQANEAAQLPPAPLPRHALETPALAPAQAPAAAAHYEELEDLEEVEDAEEAEDEVLTVAASAPAPSLEPPALPQAQVGVPDYEELEELEAVDEGDESEVPAAPAPVLAPPPAHVLEPSRPLAPIVMARPRPIEAAAPELVEVEELEELEELESLDEVGEILGEEKPAYGDLRSMAAQALALASDDDDVPLIPESSGLELADEADISDLIGFVEADEGEKSDFLDMVSPSEAYGELESVEEADEVEDLEPVPEAVPGLADATVMVDIPETGKPIHIRPDIGHEMESFLNLDLGSLDLSSLEGSTEAWEDGPAGAREIDAIRTAESPVLSPPPAEFPLVSPETSEILEALPEAEEGQAWADDEASAVEELIGSFTPYRRPQGGAPAFSAMAAVEDLPAFDDTEEGSDSEDLLAIDDFPSLLPSSEEDYNDEEPLAPEDGPIVFKNGVFFLQGGAEPSLDSGPSGLDPELKGLIDSVLSHPEAGTDELPPLDEAPGLD